MLCPRRDIALFIVFAVVYVVSASSHEPELCGPRNLTCIAGQATCINNTCVCDKSKYAWGDGHFACYKKNEVAAEIRNDPAFTTFTNFTFAFEFPCRYRLTHVRQELKDANKNVIGSCEFQINSFNKRNIGRIFVHGVDIAAKISYNNGTVVERSVIKYGNSSSGVADFTVNGVRDYALDGPWTPSQDIEYHDDANNIHIFCFEDVPNNRYVFEIKKCGLRVTFTPYDVVDRRNQVRIPGLSVAINCAHHPVWLSKDETIGLYPGWQGETDEEGYYEFQQTLSMYLTYRALTTNVPQTHPDASPSCSDVGPLYEICTSKSNIVYWAGRAFCDWIIRYPSFVKCISKNGFDFVDVLTSCVSSWCSDGGCADVVSAISVCSHLTDDIFSMSLLLDVYKCRNGKWSLI